MRKQEAVLVFIVAGLVVAVTLLVFQSRALTFKLQALEAKQANPQLVVSPPLKIRDTDPPNKFTAPQGEGPAPSRPPETPPKPAPLPDTVLAKASTNEAAALSPAQEEAVARSVDRILNEKYGHLPKAPNPDDLEKVLNKELNLTESQKARIAELLKKKRDEMRALFESEDPTGGVSIKSGMAIERKYDGLIKNELDAAQQAKYEQLKKDGKIPQGLVVQIQAKDDKD